MTKTTHSLCNALWFGVACALCWTPPWSVAHGQAKKDLTMERVQHLPVDGFRDALYVEPEGGTESAKPVVVVVHGRRTKPEWACARWRDVVRAEAWVVCPRGIPDDSLGKGRDLWTFKNKHTIVLEIEATLRALEAKYPGKVLHTSQRTYVGSSLGANVAAEVLALSKQNLYSRLVLVEGGMERLSLRRVRMLQARGIQGIMMAMSQASWRHKAARLVPMLKKEGLVGVFVDMKGAGHGYSKDFATTGRAGFERLLSSPK